MKKAFFAVLITLTLATAAYSQVAVGFRLPFSMSSWSSEDFSSSEMWVGGAGTFEYDFLPILGAEASVGYLMSLGGKSKVDGVTAGEWKNNIIPITVLLKFYLPLGAESPIQFYFAGGPTLSVSMTTTTVKTDGDYKKTGSGTDITLGGLGTLAAGLDYAIAKAIKIGGTLELLFNSSSYTPEGGKSSSSTAIGFGLGAGFKYCF